MISRRDVLRATALGLVAAACEKNPSSTTQTTNVTPTPPKKKRILILGGTGFLGPATIDAAIARGHHITIFNRGKREKFLPLKHDVEHLYGNRDPLLPADDEKGPDGKLLRPDGSPKGLEQLAGKTWDVVIDNSGFFPRMVKASADLLAKQAKHYIYISSISAYDEMSVPANGGTEDTKLATLADPTVETMGKEFENYGGLKALCEKATHAAFPGRATIVRPGYIVGPGDPTDRFTYWPVRIKKGGEVLAPGSPDDPVQWIDVRDLAEWLVMLVENETFGDFHAVGPENPGRWGDVLETCVSEAGSGAKLTWVSHDWLKANELGEDGAFPIWSAPVGKYAGFHRWNNDRAEKAGLKFRTGKDTIAALLAWYPQEVERRVRVHNELAEAAKTKGTPPPKGDPNALRAGIPMEKEQEILAKFKASAPAGKRP
jgi:2'-hydroxyisoflavone reductase